MPHRRRSCSLSVSIVTEGQLTFLEHGKILKFSLFIKVVVNT